MRQSTAVWEKSEHKGSALLMMLALADMADDDGVCWPSIPYLARKTRLGERQTYEIISNLIASEELLLLRGGGGRTSNKYQINLTPPANITGGVVRNRAPMSHGPSETSIETSVLPQTSSDTTYLQKSVAPDQQVPTANVYVDQLVQEVGNILPAMTQSRKARYGREFKQQMDGGANMDTLYEAVGRIAERWPDHQLSVEQAIRDNQKRRAQRREDMPHPQGDRDGGSYVQKPSQEWYDEQFNRRLNNKEAE